ncbi:MAG: dihydropteroate synthase [Promethearchaeota archaeon]
MNAINANFFNGSLKIGDNHPTIIMGVLNLSPESFYRGSVYEKPQALEKATKNMINNGATILDLGARSTAPWSQKISIKEELDRLVPAMDSVCRIIPKNIVISIDTQYSSVAKEAYEISLKHDKNVIINDVSCLKTDPSLTDFIIESQIPIILMASRKIPGDLCTLEEIIKEFEITIQNLKNNGYDEKLIILDPGIGKWIKEKTHEYDLKIISNLEKLRILEKPILVAISRKSFIGTTLNIPEPENRLNGTLAATTIAIYNGAHIVRTHDVNSQLLEMVKIAEEIKKNKQSL